MTNQTPSNSVVTDQPWEFDPEENNITCNGAPIFSVYRADDFPCIEDDERPAADMDYLAHAQVTVMVLNAIANAQEPTLGDTLRTLAMESANTTGSDKLVERMVEIANRDDTTGLATDALREGAERIEDLNAIATPDTVLEEAAIRQQIINTPETADFMAGVPIEAAHQRERWGADHDAGKSPFDWFWLVGYLAQKAATAQMAGEADKARHHTISTAAALANWHLAISGTNTAMRPGIDPPDEQWTCEPCQAVNFGIRRVCRFCKQPRPVGDTDNA